MARAKLHKGNFPDPEFYRFVVRCGDWKVYVSREMNENGFYTLKVVSLVPKEKSNFYLTFSLSLGRIIKNKNRGIFEERHPEDLKGIEEVLRWYFLGKGMKREDGNIKEMKIKFNHNYFKLHNQTKAELIDIKRIVIDKDIPPELLEYDTAYDGGRYELKDGDYVMLVFLGNLGIPFTTIRSAKGRYGDKYLYYHPHIGDMFDVVVKDEEKE